MTLLNKEVDVLEDGISFLKLHKACAEDLDPVNDARISFNKQKEVMDLSDERLIHWLIKNKHHSPFSHTFFKFRAKVPIFIARQWFKHTVWHSYNEVSGRYTEMKPEFYIPQNFRKQVGKPGQYTYEDFTKDQSREWVDDVVLSNDASWEAYQWMLKHDVAPEHARIVLPMNIYTEFVWSCNALSLMNFITLRSHSTAQWEIQQYSNQALKSLQEFMPVTADAYLNTLEEGYEFG